MCQHHTFQEPFGCAPVDGDQGYRRVRSEKSGYVIQLGISDGMVHGSLLMASGDGIPQRHAVSGQGMDALLVGKSP